MVMDGVIVLIWWGRVYWDFSFDFDMCLVLVVQKWVDFIFIEFDLFVVFFEVKQRVCSKVELVCGFCGLLVGVNDYVSELDKCVIEMYIVNLCCKFGDWLVQLCYIEIVCGVGYCFMLIVDELS